MNNPLHIQVPPIGGQQLDADWRKKAQQRAAMADAHYRYELQNAWKRGNEGPDPNTMRAARLSSSGRASSQSAMPIQGTHSSPSSPSWEDIVGRK
jgi:hypothetical protein